MKFGADAPIWRGEEQEDFCKEPACFSKVRD
jgi:hypothetical protein